MSLFVRVATPADVPRLVELNHAAYPDLVEEGVVFDEAQIRAHLATFPCGQLVAEIEEGGPTDRGGRRIIGAIATMIVPRAINPLGPHTWMGVTDGGTFVRHDAEGDTLYLADIYVDAAAWGRGVGRELYRALFDLCRELGLRRVVAGGRLYDYSEHAAEMTPQQYVARVVVGELRDRVLVSQLRAGFEVKGLLQNYLHDWRSQHWATLLVWNNDALPKPVAAPLPSFVAPLSGR